MRLVEAILSIPFLVLALLAVSMAGPELVRLASSSLVLVVALIYTPRIARMARAAALDIVTRDYVTAARLRGERDTLRGAPRNAAQRHGHSAGRVRGTRRLCADPHRHAWLPGLRMRPPTPEWGLMISEYRNLLTVQPMAVFGPGIMLSTLVIGLNFFTEGLARVLGRSPMRGAGMSGPVLSRFAASPSTIGRRPAGSAPSTMSAST